MRNSLILFLLPLFGYGQFASSGTATDQNGNSFEWINYGTQDWSIENAEVVTYRDGTPIPQVTDDDGWFSLTTGAWCYYDNDSSNSKLYNAYAIIGKHDDDPNTPNKEFAPDGWSVPANEDWGYLLSSIGMEYSLFSLPHGQISDGNEGSKLSGSENLWFNNPNNCSGGLEGINGFLVSNSEFNSSGFNWTPDGYRSGAWSGQNPSFCLINEWGHLWSITSDNSYYYRFAVTHNQTGLSQTIGLNTYGLSVRYVRDTPIFSTENCTGSSGNQLVNGSFEEPIQPNIGNNFLTWPIEGWDGFGAIPNIVKTNGFLSTGGPTNAQSGVQYLDIVGSESDFYQEFEFYCNTQVFFSGYFSVRDNISSTGRIDLIRVNSDNNTTLIASSNQLNMPSTPNIWYLASGSTVLQPGSYRFNITMGQNSNFDNACFSFDNINIDTGSYGPLCENRSILLTGLPTNSFGSWSGIGITDNGDGTASFNPSGLGGTIVTATYDYYDEFGLGCTQTTDILINSSPSIEAPPSYVLCDDSNAGDLEETFDLSSIDTAVIGSQTGVVVSYHANSQEAQDNTSPLPTLYSSTSQTIYVALETTSTGCRAVVPLDLVVSPIPENFQTQEINICDYIIVSDLFFDYPDINIYNSPNSIQPLNPSTPLNIGTYYITQLNQFGCKSIDLIDVYMSCFPNIPNGFSPNGDGLNDYFNIQNLYDVYLEHKLKVFNRFGTLVFEGDNSKKWEGYSDSSGNIVPVGTYFYYLELNNLSNDKFTGWVYINY